MSDAREHRRTGHEHAVEGLLRAGLGQRHTHSGERAIERLRASINDENSVLKLEQDDLIPSDVGQLRASVSPDQASSNNNRTSMAQGMAQVASSRTTQASLKKLMFRRLHVSIAATIACVFILGAVLLYQGQDSTTALKLASVEGTVRITRSNGDTVLAEKNMQLLTGDSLSIGPAASVSAAFSDGTSITSSDAGEFTNKSTDGGKHIHLIIGALTADVAKQPSVKPMILSSEEAQVKVLGTQVVWRHQINSVVVVRKGEVLVSRIHDKAEAVVSAGQELNVSLDEPLQVMPIGHLEQLRNRLTSQPQSPFEMGSGTGLFAEYFNGSDFTDFTFSRIDREVNFSLSEGQKIDPRIDINNYSIRWNGELQPLRTGRHSFRVISNDSIRVWIDNKLIVANTRPRHGTRIENATVELEAGRRYPIRIEYTQARFDATLQIYWKYTGSTFELLPTSQLYPINPNGSPAPK